MCNINSCDNHINDNKGGESNKNNNKTLKK